MTDSMKSSGVRPLAAISAALAVVALFGVPFFRPPYRLWPFGAAILLGNYFGFPATTSDGGTHPGSYLAIFTEPSG